MSAWWGIGMRTVTEPRTMNWCLPSEKGPSKPRARKTRTSSARRTGAKGGIAYAVALIVSSWPSTTGSERFRDTRNRIHSSRTSYSSSRHCSSVGAFA
jgi:hypothetical protein